MPLDVCGAVVKRELDYWKIDDRLIEACCWTSYSSYIDNQRTLSEFNKTVVKETQDVMAMKNEKGWRSLKMVIWMILDHPRSSRLAMVRRDASQVFISKVLAQYLSF